MKKIINWLRLRKWRKIIKESGMFDEKYYLFENPDVRNADIEPIKHYIKYGVNEGRNPNTWFNTKTYLQKYSDINPHQFNPFIHYILYGKDEGRNTDLYIIKKNKPTVDVKIQTQNIYTPTAWDSEEYKKCPIICLPKFDSIEVSIIMPVYNKAHFTYNALDSITKMVSNISYEVIVMDDNSNEEYAINLSDKVQNISFIRNMHNLGFLKNCNKGAALAKGKYIVFLNNDVEVFPNWLNSLIKTFDDKTVGMAGSKLIYPDGTLQEAGGIIWKDGSGKNYGRGDNPKKSKYNYLRETDYISGASIAISKRLFFDIGGFDERYTPAYYEDTDLAFSVREKGYRVIYQPQSEVIHFEGISHGTSISSGIKKYQQVNQLRFFEKWKDELSNHAVPNQQLFLAINHSFTKKHILIIDKDIPQYDKDAGSRFLYHYILLFKDLGFSVTYVPDDSKEIKKYSEELQQKGIYILYKNNDDKLLNHLKNFGKNYDYVYVNRPNIARKYMYNIKTYTHAKKFYFCHDLHFLRLSRDPSSQLKDLEKKHQKKAELNIIKEFDVIHTPSTFEENYLKKELPKKTIRTIPLFLFDYYQTLSSITVIGSQNNLLFVGGFLHKPNVDGLLWFMKSIFPIIKKAIPEIGITIVGSNPPNEIQKLQRIDAVNVLGYITDDELKKVYQESKLCVLPLRFGAGLKGKIIEAIYYNIPLVATSIAAEGLPQNIYEKLDISDEEEKFAEMVIAKYHYGELHLQEELSSELKKYFSKINAQSIFEKDMEV